MPMTPNTAATIGRQLPRPAVCLAQFAGARGSEYRTALVWGRKRQTAGARDGGATRVGWWEADRVTDDDGGGW